MKNFLNVVFVFFLLIGFIGCNADDDGNHDTENKISFSVEGSLMPGNYLIQQTYDENNDETAWDNGIVTGMVVPTENGDQIAIVTFSDQNQKLSVTLSIPAKTGVFEVLDDDIEQYMSITNTNPNTMGEDYTILASKTMSVNVSEFESGSMGAFGTIRKMRGTFNGVMVHKDIQNQMEYPHTVTGEFVVNQFF